MLLQCEQCDATVDASVVGNYTSSGDFDIATRYSLARCPLCESPLLVEQVQDWEDWTSPKRLFPASDSGLDASVPKEILSSFDEARRCLRAKAFTAAAIMCRKTLEGVCAAHEATGNLATSLKSLRDSGAIDHRLYEWADQLRVFGNEAAHGVDVSVSAVDASDTLEFTRALIEYLFTFQDRFESFKKRRAERETPY